MPLELTPDQEAKFFETGELPANLQVPVDAPAITPIEAPAIDLPSLTPPAAAPAPAQPDAATLLQRQLIEAESRRAATEQQLADLVGQLQALQAEVPDDTPDPNVDPFGHMQRQIANVSASIQQLQNDLATQQMQAAQASQFQQFVGQVRELRDAFIKTTPDFMDAYQHIRGVRLNDLRDAGIPENMLPAALLQDEIAVAQAAISVGKNPAQALYDMAKRHGYAGRPGTPAAAGTSGTNPVLAAAQAKLAQVQAGQAAAVSVPRGAPEVVLTPEALKNASNDDINKIVQSDDLWNKVAGGRPMGKDIF